MLNRADVIKWAQEAGIPVSEKNSFADDMYISVLYRFATIATGALRDEMCEKAMKLVEEAMVYEREACARVCEDIEMRNTWQGPADCAAAIRARSQS